MLASLQSVRKAVALTARDFDISSSSEEEMLRVIDELGAIRRLVDGMLARAAKGVADAGTPRDHDAATLVARSLGVAARETRSAIVTAERLEQLPATDAAVREGRLSASQARMITEAAIVNPDAEGQLLATAPLGLVPLRDACIAARAEVEDPTTRAARQHSQRLCRVWTDVDGMVSGRFKLTPEVGAQVKATLDAQVQRIFRSRRAGHEHEPNDAYAADALAALVLGDATSHGASATVHILVDHGALVRGGAVGGETCEIPGVGPVDVAWVRELLGSAFLTAVVKRGKDILTVAHLGRHVPAEVRTALIVSGRECDVEGCHNRGYLERDHVHDHAKGGPTAFSNLGWLCYRHHRLKSNGWKLGAADPVTGKRALRPPPARAA